MKTVWNKKKNPTSLPHPRTLILRKKDDKQHRLSQAELNDLIRDLDLSKEKAEILGSRLQQWNLLERDVRVSQYRRHRDLLPFFF